MSDHTQRPLRICAYASNGVGLGHISRCLSIGKALRALAPRSLRFHLLTTARTALPASFRTWVTVHRINKRGASNLLTPTQLETGRSAVLTTIANLQPDILLIDSLPAGVFREFGTPGFLGDRHSVFIARERRPDRLNRSWERPLLEMFAHVVVPHEPGSNIRVPLPLRDVPVDWVGEVVMYQAAELYDRKRALKELGIVGGEDATKRGLVLATNLREPRTQHLLVSLEQAFGGDLLPPALCLYLTCPQAMEKALPTSGVFVPIRHYPLEPCMRAFDFVIGPAGYNAMYSAAVAEVRGAFYALQRNVDDQKARLDRAVASGLCVEVASTQDVAGVARVVRQLVPQSQGSTKRLDDHGAVRAAARILQRFRESLAS